MMDVDKDLRKRRLIGNVLLILTAMIWGMAFVFKRVGMQSVEPITFTASRMALAAIASLPVAWISGKRSMKGMDAPTAEKSRQFRRNTLIGGVCCGSFLAAANILQQMGVAYTTAGKAGFITAMYILFVPVINTVLFKKRQSLLVWLAVSVGTAGLYLLCATEGFHFARGDILVALCALMFAGHILCCGHYVQISDPMGISCVQFFTTTVLSAVFAFLLETPSWEKIVSAAVPILYCGLISGGVGYSLQILAQRFTDSTVASLLLSLESVFAVLAGTFFLNEQMTMREVLGCVLLFIAIILVQVPVLGGRKRNVEADDGGARCQ